MTGWRRKPATRVPHEDPGIELQLQRILGARERITRAIVSITDYQEEIVQLLQASRAMSEMVVQVGMAPSEDRVLRQIDLNDQRVKWLQAEMRTLEESIEQAQELIQAIGKDLTSEDLDHLS